MRNESPKRKVYSLYILCSISLKNNIHILKPNFKYICPFPADLQAELRNQVQTIDLMSELYRKKNTTS